jgi:hypothetical protein
MRKDLRNAKSDILFMFSLLFVFVSLFSLGVYLDQMDTKELRSKYKYKVRDNDGYLMGYTNKNPEKGCIVVDHPLRADYVCGTFVLTKF